MNQKRTPQTLLLTGFEPFGGDSSNPSWAIAQALDGLGIEGFRVSSHRLPVDGSRAPKVLTKLIDAKQPAAVVMLGLARGRVQIALERVAINALDYRIPDNAGRVRRDQPIIKNGPDAYLTTLPTEAILRAWYERAMPGYVSNTAGLYLCNQVFYAARHHLASSGRDRVPAGFIHLPSDESLVLDSLEAFVPLAFQIETVRAALEVTGSLLKGNQQRASRASGATTTRPVR